MTTLNQQLSEISTFNNASIVSVDFFSWGGAMVKFDASNFAFEGIKKALNIKIESMGNNEFMFISMMPHVD